MKKSEEPRRTNHPVVLEWSPLKSKPEGAWVAYSPSFTFIIAQGDTRAEAIAEYDSMYADNVAHYAELGMELPEAEELWSKVGMPGEW
jgi:predicted RNase H-like HicB family nuclease